MTASAGPEDDLREDVDGGDVEERSGTEEHGESRGIEGGQGLFALLGKAKVGGQSGQRGGKGEDEEVAPDSEPVQPVSEEESDEAEGGRGFVQHNSQEDDHLRGGVGRCGGRSQGYPVRGCVDH